MDYKQKYFKYKSKYLNLKRKVGYNQTGGGNVSQEKVDEIISTWKYDLPKKMVKKYIEKFGLPYDACKDQIIWKEEEKEKEKKMKGGGMMKEYTGFDKTWVLDEEITHTYPVGHIDFVYSTIKVPGVKPEHVCSIARATGSIFIDMLKQEATARCHYLVKNAVSLSFVQDVVAGKISLEKARDEYGRRILTNQYNHDWFKDPLKEADETLGEGKHHLLLSGEKHEHV